MAFVDRIVDYPGRVKLTAVSGQTDTYDVTRTEGAVTEAGTLLNANNLNTMTQVDSDVVTELTTAGMTSGTYQNDMSDAISYLLSKVAPVTAQTNHVTAGTNATITSQTTITIGNIAIYNFVAKTTAAASAGNQYVIANISDTIVARIAASGNGGSYHISDGGAVQWRASSAFSSGLSLTVQIVALIS